ncbi:MAG: glycosyltransferase family 2 protein [Patescibacteria group bacterium]
MTFLKLSSISFFCPAYHDSGNLPKLIPEVVTFLSSVTDVFEVIIVEDGSPDDTGRVADDLARQYSQVRVIHHPKNLGYGAALRSGFQAARYDFIMYTDGDRQYDVNEFKPYLSLLAKYDVISGYAISKNVSLRRRLQSWTYNVLLLALFWVWYRDANCSMKVYRRHVLDTIKIQSTSAFIDGEMLIKTKRAGFHIGWFPVHHLPRMTGIASGSNITVIADTIRDMILFRIGLL